MPPNNPMTTWGNEKTMNLNMLVLTNIQSSPYFKVNLFELKTYHEVIDEIFYRVSHLEPWEKGSRKTSGQTGMCGGVRGVGAGGIVSSAYCLLYKLFTLKLTKKQLIGLITHKDSPYIRGLGFMYIRYTQPPADLWAWYEDYLDDEEEVDVKAGGGHVMTVGEMLRQWLVKLEWYSTLFPRIPVPIEKDLAAKLKTRPVLYQQEPEPEPEHIPDNQVSFGEAARRGGGGGGDFRDDGARGNYQADNYRASREKDFRGSNDRDFRGSNDRDVRGSRDRDIRGSRDRDVRGSRDRDVRGSRDRDVRGSREKDIRGSREKDIRGSRDRDVRGGRDGNDGRDADYRRPSPSQRHNRSSPSHRSSASRRSRSPPPRRSPPRSFERASSFERDLARERERHARKDRDHGRKEKKERSRSGERSSSHKHSHRDKDRHKEREERSSSHKHKNRDKDRR